MRNARTVVCEDVCLKEGHRVLETGEFLNGVDSAGIAAYRGEREGGRKIRGLTGRRGGGDRIRGPWHPGSRVRWCLDGGKQDEWG